MSPDAPQTFERRQTIVPASNQVPYIIAVVVMMGLGVGAVVALTVVRPEADNTILIGLIFGFLAPTTLSLLAFMKSQETHLSVNSRLDAFMAQARLASHAQGFAQGRDAGQDRADQRTDALAAHQGVPVIGPTSIPQVEAPVIVIAPPTRD